MVFASVVSNMKEVININKRGYMPALAILVLALLFAFVILTAMPEVKATAIELIRAVTS